MKRKIGVLAVAFLAVLSLISFTSRAVTPVAHANFCDHTGRNTQGSLRRLHVDTTSHLIVDGQGCQVMLRGVNVMLGTGKGGSTQIETQINYLAANAKVNVVRINFQAVWYDENVDVHSDVNMYYQTWVDTIIQNDDAHGVYTMLDKGEQYTEPPCIGDGSDFCGDQNTGGQEAKGTPEAGDPDYTGGITDPDAWQEASDGNYMQPAYDDWTLIGQTYANDPGVLYEIWNENANYINTNPTQWWSNQDQMITDIRNGAPQSLIFYYAKQDNDHNLPPFTESNLVEDFHIYNTNFPQDCSQLETDETAAYNAGHALSVNEWGDVGGATIEPYNTYLNNCATNDNPPPGTNGICGCVGLIYYTMGYLFQSDGITLNTNGSDYKTDNINDYANYPSS